MKIRDSRRQQKLAINFIQLLIFGYALTSAKAAVTPPDIGLADYGIGYIEPTLLGSAMTVTALNDMVKVYNGVATSPISGENYIVDKGSLTPSQLPGLAPYLGHIRTPSAADGYGSPTATIHLGNGGYKYLTAQWDGPNGAIAVYYIAGLKGDLTLINDLPGTFNGNHPQSQLGLSGYELSLPEPTTLIAGALLILPFGASTLRALRRGKCLQFNYYK